LYPSSANYILVELKEGMTSRELKDRLLPHRILIRDCSSFMGLSGQFFRIAVRTGEENKRLLECLGRILK
jgi:threonine-phosphate decarboxylase